MYAAHLGAEHLPTNVKLGGIMSFPRPQPASEHEIEAMPYDALPDPAEDPTLPRPIPRGCFDAFAKKGRWFHGGGRGPGTKNYAYSKEVLSQLYYKGVVTRMVGHARAREGGGGHHVSSLKYSQLTGL